MEAGCPGYWLFHLYKAPAEVVVVVAAEDPHRHPGEEAGSKPRLGRLSGWEWKLEWAACLRWLG